MSTDLRYVTKNSLPRLKNFGVSVQNPYRFDFYRVFWVFQHFSSVPRLKNFRPSVKFPYHVVLCRFFRGQNEMVQWMVEILQVLNINKRGRNWSILKTKLKLSIVKSRVANRTKECLKGMYYQLSDLSWCEVNCGTSCQWIYRQSI